MAANPLHCAYRVFAATRRNASLADFRIGGNFHDHNIGITTPGIFKNCARDIDGDNTPVGQIFINIAAHAIFKSMRLPHQGKCSMWRLVHQKPAHQGSCGPRLLASTFRVTQRLGNAKRLIACKASHGIAQNAVLAGPAWAYNQYQPSSHRTLIPSRHTRRTTGRPLLTLT